MRALPLAVFVLGGIIAIGAAIGGATAIVAAVATAIAFATIAWRAGPAIVARRIGARPFAGAEPSALRRALAAVQSTADGEITVLRADALLPNAVALGDGRIVLSDGLLQALSEDELQAVLRHLRSRSASARRDAAVAVLLLPALIVAALLKSVLMVLVAFSQSEVEGGAVGEAQSIGVLFAGIAVGPIARFLLWLGAGRAAVWPADAAATPLAQQHEALVSALKRIDSRLRPPIVFGAARYSLISLFWNHLFFVSPLDHTPLQRFALLPSSRARISRLRELGVEG